MHDRTVWARGLTATNAGTRISTSAQVVVPNDMILRSVEHFNGRTVMTVLATVEIEHDAEVTLHE